MESTPVSMTQGQQLIAPHPNGVAALKRQHSELTPDEVDMMSRRSKRLRRDMPTVVGSNMHHSRMGAARSQTTKDRGDYRPGETCESCGKPDEPHKLLRCETCDNEGDTSDDDRSTDGWVDGCRGEKAGGSGSEEAGRSGGEEAVGSGG